MVSGGYWDVFVVACDHCADVGVDANAVKYVGKHGNWGEI